EGGAALVLLGDDAEALLVHRAGGEHDRGRLRLGQRGPRLLHEIAEHEGQLPQALVRDGGDVDDRHLPLGELVADHVGHVRAVGQVGLVQHDDGGPLHERNAPLGLLVEARRVARELVLDRGEVACGVAVGFERGGVQHVHQDVTALDVAQEVQAQALALARAGDQPGNVRDGVAVLARLDHAEVRHERGEGVVGDLRPGGAHRSDEGGLAGTGVAHQGDVRDGLQLEHEGALLAGFAEQRESGGLALRVRQRRVAQSPAATAGGDEAGADADQVGQHGAVRRSDHGAVGHREHEILPACAVAQVALAETAAGGPLVRAVVVGQQRRGGGVDLEDHVTAAPAVGPVGPGQGLALLAADGGGAVPARSHDDLEVDAVDECGHGCTPMLRRRNGSRGGAFGSAPRRTLCAPGAGASGQTVSTTLTTLRSRLRPNSTVPAVSANRVSSLPRPTPSPGWILVPRWRTRISPAPTTWPPKRLTPRRWALESRPFLEELTPFLDAIWNQSLSGRGIAQAMPVIFSRVSSWRWPWRFL